MDGFEAAMAEQKAKARAAWAGSGEAADQAIWFDIAEEVGATDFLGYDTETAEGQIAALVRRAPHRDGGKRARRCRSCSTRRRSTPRRADRSATPAR